MTEDLDIAGPDRIVDPSPAQPPSKCARGAWAPVAVSAGLALIGFACFAYPMYVIRPFRHQGVTELAVALAVKQVVSAVTILCAVFAAIALIGFWRRYSIPKRVLATFFTLVACSSIWLARFNMYEIMFHPMGTPAVEPAQTAKIDPDDMVLAVNVNQSARAYPIRTMGYHHIANDWVGGEPIVATY